MAPKIKVTQNDIIDASLKLIRMHGIGYINARSLAKELKCSTQPVFRNFETMDILRDAINHAISGYYNHFINQRIDKTHYLSTISNAYVEFARQEPYLFEALFIIAARNSRDIDEIVSSSWNRDTIEAEVREYNITFSQAEELYCDIRFYTHGIATQVYTRSLRISSSEVEELIDKTIQKLIS